MKQRIFSGIQPSGNLHIGNYLGAVKNWVAMQDNYNSIFCIVDLHAITVPQKPDTLRQRVLEVAKIYLASGIDPNKSTIFIQSHIPEHTELTWLLNTITKNGELTRMTQSKSKALVDFDEFENTLKELSTTNHKAISVNSKKLIKKIPSEKAAEISKESSFETASHFFSLLLKQFNSVGVGLYSYPVLMAADILLYDTEIVPVGEDQLQHIELTRTLARRFNKKFGETFIIPKSHLTKIGMRVMGLDDPTKKMSKSATSEYNYISLLDAPEIIEKKIKKAVTDSETTITYSDDRPALKNLINIFSAFSGKSPQEIEKEFIGKGYADFKQSLTDVILSFIVPFQKKYNSLNDEDVYEILEKGATKIRPLAQQKIIQVKKAMGLS